MKLDIIDKIMKSIIENTDGRAFLKTLTREQLLWGLDDPEELTEKTNAELIELLVQEDLWEIYGNDIEDFYHDEAEKEYAEMKQASGELNSGKCFNGNF